MIDKNLLKNFVGAFFMCVIIITVIMVYQQRDIFFENKVVIEYTDGCKEIYVDAILQTSECQKDDPLNTLRKPWEQKINLSLSLNLT